MSHCFPDRARAGGTFCCTTCFQAAPRKVRELADGVRSQGRIVNLGCETKFRND